MFLFVVGVVIGFVNGDGVVGIVVIIGYLVMNVFMSVVFFVNGIIFFDLIERVKFFMENYLVYVNMFGIFILVIGVFGGIIVGVLVVLLFNKFYIIELL